MCAFLVGCASEPQHITSTFVHRETLFAGARAGAESGFRLLRVDHDGTAYIRSPDDRRIHRVRPEKDDGIAGDDKQVEPWTLEATDPVKQTATLSILVDG